MKIDTRIVYAAPPAEVSTMTFDRDFQARKCEATGAVSFRVDLTADAGGGAQIKTERQMPTDGFPDFVRSMVGATVDVIEVDDWSAAGPDGGRSGSITVTISGAPLQLTGSLTLQPSADGAVVLVDADLKASIPFLGGQLEKAAAPAILAAVEAEERTAQVWLAEHGTAGTR